MEALERLWVVLRMGKGVRVLCVVAREKAVGRGEGELDAVEEGGAGV